MKNRNIIFRLAALVLTAGSVSIPGAQIAGAQAKQTAPVAERGKFLFFDTKQPQGEESYETISENNALVVRSQLKLESETKISLSATLRMHLDLTPISLEIKGTK